MNKRIEFSEVQRYPIKWAWGLIIALNGLFLYAIVQQVIFRQPFGTKPASDLALILIELAMIGVAFFLWTIRLVTTIHSKGIEYRFYPFQTKTTLIEWEELSNAYMREYNSYYEFGGWGIRVGNSKNHRAINTTKSSATGLQLEFKDGRLLLIGTRQPELLDMIISEKVNTGIIRWANLSREQFN